MEHSPEFFLRQMFHICADVATKSGEFSGKCSKLLNRHFLYSHVKEKSKLSQKAIKILQPRKGIIARCAALKQVVALTKHNQIPNGQSHYSVLPSQSRRRQTSLALKAPRAFNLEQARRSELLSRAKSQRSSRSSRSFLWT